MDVSGELRYLGPDFSSVERVRPVKAMILPESLEIGNMTRLRNLEYRLWALGAGVWGPDFGLCKPDFGLWASLSRSVLSFPAERGFCSSPLSFPAERGFFIC